MSKIIKVIFSLLILITLIELIYYFAIIKWPLTNNTLDSASRTISSSSANVKPTPNNLLTDIPAKYTKSEVMKQQLDNLYYYIGDETVQTITTELNYKGKITKILTEEDMKKDPKNRDPEGNYPALMLQLTANNKSTNTYYSKRNVEEMKIYDKNDKQIAFDPIQKILDKSVTIKKSYQLKNIANSSDPGMILFAIEIHMLE